MKRSLVILVALLALAMLFVSCSVEPESLIPYTVNYNANGGEGSIESKTVTSGTKITLAENTFTKTGYHSGKWALGSPDGLTQDVKTEYTVTGNITLYAVWEANTYYVDCYPNGGTGGVGEYERNTFTYDEEGTLY